MGRPQPDHHGFRLPAAGCPDPRDAVDEAVDGAQPAPVHLRARRGQISTLSVKQTAPAGATAVTRQNERANDTRQGPAGALLSALGLSHAQRLPVLHQSTQTDWRTDRWTNSPSGCLGELTSGLPHHWDDLSLSLCLSRTQAPFSPSPWTKCGAGCSREVYLSGTLPSCMPHSRLPYRTRSRCLVMPATPHSTPSFTAGCMTLKHAALTYL